MLYKLHPGSYLPLGKESIVIPDQIAAEQALESAVYLSDAFTISEKLTFDAGIRFSIFNYLGPHNTNVYAFGQPKTINTLENTIENTSKGILKNLFGSRIPAFFEIYFYR